MRLFYLSIIALFLVSSSVTTILYAEDDDTEGLEQLSEEGQEEPSGEEGEPAEAPEADA